MFLKLWATSSVACLGSKQVSWIKPRRNFKVFAKKDDPPPPQGPDGKNRPSGVVTVRPKEILYSSEHIIGCVYMCLNCKRLKKNQVRQEAIIVFY